MKSCLYEGVVRHRRFTPVAHSFRYRLMLLYLDLSELDSVFSDRWLWSAGKRHALAHFHRADHLGDPTLSLDEAVRNLVSQRTGRRPAGPIRLLTQPRFFGYGFNPVSFFYCFDELDQRVETIVAEVNNTPWRERHCYVLSQDSNEAGARKHRHRFAKDFHVSPFFEMELEYDWRFVDPARQVVVHMNLERARERVFDSTLVLERRALNGANLTRMLLLHPFQTARVVLAIHWQALLLWLRRVPVHEHPKWRAQQTPGVR